MAVSLNSTKNMAKVLFKANAAYLQTSSHLPRMAFSYGHQNTGHQHHSSRTTRNHKFAIIIGGALTATLAYNQLKKDGNQRLFFLNETLAQAKDFPIYTAEEVSKHTDPNESVWVSFKENVYDITEFIENHPGGEKILLAAGSAIDPYWNLYAVHKNEEVYGILEQYKIGSLALDSRTEVDLDDPFINDPVRSPILKAGSKKPFNAEPPLQIITDSFITPNEMFYVRNHLPVPKVDPETYRMHVEVGDSKLELSLDDLKTKYTPVTITTTIQCAGNRRKEMSDYKSVKGLSWGPCAIGTAKWTGVRLKEVLADAGLTRHHPNVKHIQFDGLDSDITQTSYGASIPVLKAMSDDGDVILAYKMNGVDIPLDHGYPIRVIVPGCVGARNVKWLSKITASHEESHSHWQRNDYKGFSPSTTFADADYNKATSIQELPVVSTISHPAANSTLIREDGKVEVKGYAWSGGGRDIIRVDVSADGGTTWTEANLTKNPEKDDSSRAWAWTLWDVEVPVEENSQVEIMCKAIDESYNTQPETCAPIWNLRGFMMNAWHRVPVTIDED